MTFSRHGIAHTARTLAALTLLAGASVALGDIALQPVEPLGAKSISPTTIYMAAGRIDTLQAQPAQTLVEATAAADLDTRHIIQLDGPMTPDRRQVLEDAGVVLRDYLPSHAYIAELGGADPAAVGTLGFVRWHAAFEDAWKLSPGLAAFVPMNEERIDLDNQGRVAVMVHLFAGGDADDAVEAIFDASDSAQVFYAEMIGDQAEISVVLDKADVDSLASIKAVQFVEDAPQLSYRNSSVRWIAQSNTLFQTPIHDQGIIGDGGTTGQAEVIAVVDGQIDQGHCSFPAGKIIAYNATAGADSHGTHVAGTAAGDAGADNDTRGMAYGANIVFDTVPSFSETAMYNVLTQHHGQGARVHTNSWGDDFVDAYNGLTRGIDRFMYDNEESLVLFAVTNQSTSVWNPENAKNQLAVGATNDTPSQANHCTAGTGPTADGRQKPEVYLPGCGILSSRYNTTCSTWSLSGTSMACPAVAGSASLVRQYYREGFYPTGAASGFDGFVPSAALLKATLTNSTVDMTGVTGYPSNLEGWGRVLLDNALHFSGEDRTLIVADVRNADGFNTGESTDLVMNVSDSGEPLKVVLAWTEPAASASTGTGPAWINDLNLELIAPDGTTAYKGNFFSGGVSATGGAFDDRNNVEVALIAAPTVGAWTARVTAAAVNQGTQGYALCATGALSLGPAPLRVVLESPVPTLVPLGTPVDVQVRVDEGDDSLVGGTVMLHYAADGSTFTSTAMTPLGGDQYAGTIPGFTACGDTPAFYASAEGVTTGSTSAPPLGAAGPYTYFLGQVVTLADDDFEVDSGWARDVANDTATKGLWVRMDPEQTDVSGDVAQPGDDHTPDPGSECWVTDGLAGTSAGTYDVDGGATALLSPVFDLSGRGTATVSYARWYSNDTGADPSNDVFVIEISDDGGSNWFEVETVGPSGTEASGGWFTHEFLVEDKVALTSQVQMRFTASDAGAGSVVEALIDDFSIITTTCVDGPACAGDVDGDGDADVFDFGDLASNFGAGPGATRAQGDLTGDGWVDVFDFAELASDFGCTP